LKNLKTILSSCVLTGNKDYLSADCQLDLLTSDNIKFEDSIRVNQHNYEKQPYIFRKTRKHFEMFFSQLSDQFLIRQKYTKSFD